MGVEAYDLIPDFLLKPSTIAIETSMTATAIATAAIATLTAGAFFFPPEERERSSC